MAVEALGSAPRVKVAPWNDPVIRGWVFQIVVVGLVGLLAWYLVSNTIDNLRAAEDRQRLPLSGARGGLRDRRHDDRVLAGQHLCPRHLGRHAEHAEGVRARRHHGDHPRHRCSASAELSNNWLLAKICEWYVEAFRNVPLLLWLFLFYKLISEAFPGPRQAIGVFWNSVYLSNRGLYFPVPIAEPIHKWMGVALSDRHRWRLGRCTAGRRSGRTRPASPSRRSRRASAW